MMKRIRIFVEGDADKKFISDYYHHLFLEKAPQYSINHTGELKGDRTGGYKKLSDEINIREMRINADQGGVNLVIFDADKDTEARRKELLAIQEKYGGIFENNHGIDFINRVSNEQLKTKILHYWIENYDQIVGNEWRKALWTSEWRELCSK